jgi:enterochelin esterase-like enzyme
MESLDLWLPDPDRRLAGVRLIHRVTQPREPVEFDWDDQRAGWSLRLPSPPTRRLEYLLSLRYPDGGTEEICDPENPKRVGGAFGDKSVLELPEYREPEWLSWPAGDGHWHELAIAAPALSAEVWARIWSPTRGSRHVLVAHDGPEYDKFAALGQYSGAMTAAGRVPPHHLVLLAPGDRNEWYSANPAYTRALIDEVLPRLVEELGSDEPVVGLGASLGALAMLHAARRSPERFAGLVLQSGSFFRDHLDEQEASFRRYRRIVRFVEGVRHSQRTCVTTVLTCGVAEENLENNRAMAAVLREPLFEVPDAHNFTAWRDALDPHLTAVLRTVWGQDA